MVEPKHVGPAEQDNSPWTTNGQEVRTVQDRFTSDDYVQICDSLTLVERRRLRHLNSVDGALGSAERHQGHRAVLVLKHAVFALQVEAVQDCRKGKQHSRDTDDTHCQKQKLCCMKEETRRVLIGNKELLWKIKIPILGKTHIKLFHVIIN